MLEKIIYLESSYDDPVVLLVYDRLTDEYTEEEKIFLKFENSALIDKLLL